MGLADDLGYSHSSANPLHRVVRWGAGTRPGGWVFSRVLRHLDDAVGRLSKGRQSAPGLLAGLAVLDVTTTGRKSGRPRTSHLIATPYAGTRLVSACSDRSRTGRHAAFVLCRSFL